MRVKAQRSFKCTGSAEWQGEPVRCWKCLGCRTLRAWIKALRIHLEALGHDDRVWLCTLTFKELPKDEPIGYSLVQLWLKRVRKALGAKAGDRLRYTCVSELGGVGGRLHYHLVVYSTSSLTWRTLNRWEEGHAHFKLVNGKAASEYILKYILKGHGKVRSSIKLGVATLDKVHEHSLTKAVVEAFPGSVVTAVGGARVPRELRREGPQVTDDESGTSRMSWAEMQACEKVGPTIGMSDKRWKEVQEYQRRHGLIKRTYRDIEDNTPHIYPEDSPDEDEERD